MKIKDVIFNNNLILAPLADVSDLGFGSVCIDCGADCGVTEMISAKALMMNNVKTIDLLKTAENEKIKIVQIFGSDPDVLAKACASDYLKKFDIIDINMGCPVPKIVNNFEGSALLNDFDKASNIIKKCVESTEKPITVKFRIGFTMNDNVAVEFAKMCEKSGASAITVHGRYKEQLYSGSVDYETIKKVKQSVSIPVIANGDIDSFKKLVYVKKYTNCDAFMIGRASLGNPHIFNDLLKENHTHSKLYYIKKHISILRKNYKDNYVLPHMRKHMLWYVKGYENATDIKKQICYEKDLNSLINLLEKFFKNK